MTNLMKAFRFWKQKGYNPFEKSDDSWGLNLEGQIINNNMINDMNAIALHYKVSLEALNIIISEHTDRDITKSFQGMGGCVYRKNNLNQLLEKVS